SNLFTTGDTRSSRDCSIDDREFFRGGPSVAGACSRLPSPRRRATIARMNGKDPLKHRVNLWLKSEQALGLPSVPRVEFDEAKTQPPAAPPTMPQTPPKAQPQR